jgi:hypothetical protein
VSAQVDGAKTNPEVLKMIQPLQRLGGGGADAAAQLMVLTYSAGEASSSAVHGPTDQEEPARDVGGMIAVEDLQMQAGGRHDNDKTNFRDIKIMVTSDEVGDDWARYHIFGGAHVHALV